MYWRVEVEHLFGCSLQCVPPSAAGNQGVGRGGGGGWPRPGPSALPPTSFPRLPFYISLPPSATADYPADSLISLSPFHPHPPARYSKTKVALSFSHLTTCQVPGSSVLSLTACPLPQFRQSTRTLHSPRIDPTGKIRGSRWHTLHTWNAISIDLELDSPKFTIIPKYHMNEYDNVKLS